MAKKYKINRKFTFEGKTYYIHADTEKEYAEKYLKKIKELENGVTIKGGETILNDWANEVFEVYLTCQENTKNEFIKSTKRLVLSKIGHMRLKDIKPIHCQKVVNEVSHLSQYTINTTNRIMNLLFNKAVENNLILKNPATGIMKPKGYKSGRRAITEHEREHIIKVCSQTRKYYMFLLMLFCGCRPKEACEVMGKDIQTIDGKHLLHIRGTKSANADRFVPIPNILYDLIKNTPKFEYIACYQTGTQIKEINRSRVWNSCKRELNISMGCKVYRNQLIPPYPVAPDLVPYCLRHTYCTDLARKGVDIRIAQKLMGHSDISLTANIYTNLDKSDILSVADIINEPISNLKKSI